MAFVNIKLTATERKELAEKHIINPYGSYRDTTEGITPLYLTIDKDTGMWLASCYQHHDINIDLNEFLFMFRSCPVPVQAQRNVHQEQVSWKITRIDLPRDLLSEKEHITTALIDAFRAYGIFGSPEEENANAEVICDTNKVFI